MISAFQDWWRIVVAWVVVVAAVALIVQLGDFGLSSGTEVAIGMVAGLVGLIVGMWWEFG